MISHYVSPKLPQQRDNEQRHIYDIVIIHPKKEERTRVVLEARTQGLFAFPVNSREALKDFLLGKTFEGKKVPAGPKRAKKYLLANDSQTMLSQPDELGERVLPSTLMPLIKEYHPDAVIESYVPQNTQP